MNLTAGAFQRLRFTGILVLLLVVTTGGAVYWTSVQQQREYLTSRDFRLLTGLGLQVQGLLDGHARIFQGAVEDVARGDEHGDSHGHYKTVSAWRSQAKGTIPILQHTEFDYGPPPPPSVKTLWHQTLEFQGNSSLLRTDVTAASSPDRLLTTRVPVASLLQPTFTSKLHQNVFDTLALATIDGRVVFVTGRREQELQSTTLDALLPTTIADSKRFQQLARTISIQDAMIAGVRYKLFLQPCCATVTVGGAAAAPAGAGTAAAIGGAGLLVAGLIEEERLYGAALAISPTLVIVSIAAMLLAVVVWPFLKLFFSGERQRITVWDVVQLATCSVLGLALGAIMIVTADLDTRLRADVDEQLEHLADDIGKHLQAEMRLAYQQLSLLDQRFRTCSADVFQSVTGGGTCRESAREATPPYPDYDTFALIDSEGRQQVKATPQEFVPSRIAVQGRAYVDAIINNRYWRELPACSPEAAPPSSGCFLESVWSWTDGKPQAVLSMPASSPTYPVATLAFETRALLDPVLPPGFEYAVVDGNGTVLFHSDRQRNTRENLFTETDQDRRLRALLSGHSSGALSLMYWGRPYRAYVAPAHVPDWSVITLADQQGIRGLVLEWTAVSLLMLSAYIVAWVAAIVVGVRTGTSWMWPDVRRRQRYLGLAALYAVLFVLFCAVAFTGNTKKLLDAALSIAVTAWLLALVLLWRRPPAVDIGNTTRRGNVAAEYALAGTLFLVLSGAVPGVAFVVRSYDMHIESYVKHRQLGLARALTGRTRNTHAKTDSTQTDGRWQNADLMCGDKGSQEIDRNCLFFYDTTVSTFGPPPTREAQDQQSTAQDTTHHGLLESMLEEYLPYYAESSVEMRELLHDHAADGSWSSGRTADGHLQLRVANADGSAMVVRSSLPRAVPFSTGSSRPSDSDHDEPALIMPYVAPWLLLCLGGVAYAIVRFVLRHVYLNGVSEPLWASGRLVTTAGANVLILCDDASKIAGQLRDAAILPLGDIASATDANAAWRRALIRIGRDNAGHAVVIPDLDQDLENPDRTHAKLELLDELVNDPVRTVVVLLQNPPSTLQDSLRRGHDPAHAELWPRLFKAFVVVDWRDISTLAQQPIPVTVETPAHQSNWREWLHGMPGGSPIDLGDVLASEGRHDRFLHSVCEDLRQSDAFRSGALTEEQILEEIGDRASAYYQRLWAGCSDDEKVVLGHVAMYGLTNAASRRIVRRLLVRRLLTKDPDLRLMNRTFRQFILSPEILRQVAQFEGVAEPSTWDRLRVPFALAAVSAAAFLFTTQREMFNQTVTVVTGVAAAVPTVFKAVSVIAQRDGGPGLPRA